MTTSRAATVSLSLLEYSREGLEDIKNSWPLLGMEGFDVMGLQELGGFSHLSSPWTIAELHLDGDWGFYVTNPSLACRAIAVGLPARFLPSVDHVRAFCCGICVTLN